MNAQQLKAVNQMVRKNQAPLVKDIEAEVRDHRDVWSESIKSSVRAFTSELRRQRKIREERAKARACCDPVRVAILNRLQRAVDFHEKLRTAMRKVAGSCGARPVAVVWGISSPVEKGRGYVKYHWRNGPAEGTVYHPSTRRVEVGVGYVLHHYPQVIEALLVYERKAFLGAAD